MRIITLTTDLGYRDPYLAIVKAKLLSCDNPPQIIDLSCGLKDNNISDAAFILKNALPHFPDETIHLVAVKFILDKSSTGKFGHVDNSRYLLTRYMNQYIICPDNGLFTLMDPAFDAPVYQLFYDGENKNHFFLKDVFVDVTHQLLANNKLEDFAVIVNDYYKAFGFDCYLSGDVLKGKGIYVDDFGNIITNITREKFLEYAGKRKYEIRLPGTRINKISATYEDVKYGAALILFNSFGYLEVAVNGKSAYKMLCPRDIGSNFDFNLLIEFHD
jgi:S-adenosyl-L-methionine hydrolase (adenosine-forming)